MTFRHLAINIAALMVIAQAGCVHTEITEELNAQAVRRPYRKILVCSMSEDPKVGIKVESILRDDLVPHSVTVETGRDLLYPMRERADGEVVAEIKKRHFDGILITRRIEAAVSSSTVKDVIFAAPAAHQRENEPVGSATDVQDFVSAYLRLLSTDHPASTERQLKDSATAQGVVGKEIEVHARADLLGVRENQIVWSTGGIIEGSPHRPLPEFIQSFAKTIETGLLQEKFIPADRHTN